MKKLGIICAALFIIIASGVCTVSAAAMTSEQLLAVDRLSSLGLFHGTDSGYELERTPTRQEAVAMLIRLIGEENTAKANVLRHPFTDVDEWAEPYVGYAYAYGLTSGVDVTEFGSDDTITTSQYLTLMLRALGYSSGVDFQWDKAWELSDSIGLTDGQYSDSTVFTRADVAFVSSKALDIENKNGIKLIDILVEKKAVSTTEDTEIESPISPVTMIDDAEIEDTVNIADDAEIEDSEESKPADIETARAFYKKLIIGRWAYRENMEYVFVSDGSFYMYNSGRLVAMGTYYLKEFYLDYSSMKLYIHYTSTIVSNNNSSYMTLYFTYISKTGNSMREYSGKDFTRVSSDDELTPPQNLLPDYVSDVENSLIGIWINGTNAYQFTTAGEVFVFISMFDDFYYRTSDGKYTVDNISMYGSFMVNFYITYGNPRLEGFYATIDSSCFDTMVIDQLEFKKISDKGTRVYSFTNSPGKI